MTLPTYPILPPTFLLPDTAFALSTFSTLLLDVYSNYSNYLLFESFFNHGHSDVCSHKFKCNMYLSHTTNVSCNMKVISPNLLGTYCLKKMTKQNSQFWSFDCLKIKTASNY